MLLSSLTGAVVAAVTADPQLIIWGGGVDEATARAAAERVEAARDVLKANGVALAAGYPKILESDQYPGLKPGFHVAAVGVCELPNADPVLVRLRPVEPGVYARPLKTPGLPIACPTLGPAPRSFTLPGDGFGLAASYGERMLLGLGAIAPDGPRGPYEMAAASGELRGRAWLRALPIREAAGLQVGDVLVARSPKAAHACTLAGFVEGTIGIPHFGQFNETSPSCGQASLYGVLSCPAAGVAVAMHPASRAARWLESTTAQLDPGRLDRCTARLRRIVPAEVRAALGALEATPLESGRRQYLQLRVKRTVRAELCGAPADDTGELIGLAELTAKSCELVAPFGRYGFFGAPEKLIGWLVVDGTPHAVSAGNGGLQIADRDGGFSIGYCDCGC